MSKHIVSIDIETYSSIDLPSAGVYKYAESPDFDIIIVGYAIDDEPVKVVGLADGEPFPEDLRQLLFDPDVILSAYNAQFERVCFSRYFGVDLEPENWRCSLVLAAQAGLPIGLDAVCKAMGLGKDEAKKDGDALIRYFSKPCKPTITNKGRTRNMPWDDYDKWELYKDYNKRDVEVERTIRRRLERLAPDATEQKFWCLDQIINDAGVRLDLQLAQNAIDFNNRYTDELAEEVFEISGLSNVKSVPQIKQWLQIQEGKSFDSLNKKAMPDVLANLSSDKSKKLLALRAELTKTSVAKFEKMLECACADQHARGLFQFYGANRTGRFAGRLLQLQNLPQNHLSNIADVRARVKAGLYEEMRLDFPNIASTLSELIRTAIIPEPGCHFIVADFSAIEARVIAWFAGESDDLEEFRGEGKIYELTASRMFNVPKERIVKGNPEYELRAKGKVATLACGYGGGPSALITMGALRAGIPEEELPSLVEQWRGSHQRIVRWWRSLETAAKKAIRTKATALDEIGGVRFEYDRKDLRLTLPSGRKLTYANAKIGENRFGNASVIYSGTNQTTKQWCELETYGGKLAENVVQATARDCLRDCMLRLSDEGYDIRMHVHDEVIINEPVDGRTLDEVISLMCIPPEWAPDLPLNAAGFTTDFYMKD